MRCCPMSDAVLKGEDDPLCVREDTEIVKRRLTNFRKYPTGPHLTLTPKRMQSARYRSILLGWRGGREHLRAASASLPLRLDWDTAETQIVSCLF